VLLNPLIVPRNAADTARNILAHQTQISRRDHLLYRPTALACCSAYGALSSSAPVNPRRRWRRLVSARLCVFVAYCAAQIVWPRSGFSAMRRI